MMTTLLHAIGYGLLAGCLYALVALGYSLIYSVLRFVNFAHGDLLTLGAYLCWFLSYRLGLPFPVALVCASGITGLLSMAVGLLVLVPARRRSAMGALVAAIGISVVLQNLIALTFTPDAQPFYASSAPVTVPPLPPFKAVHLVMFFGTLLGLGLLWFVFLKRTSAGVEIRACASNPQAATLQGLRRGRAFALVFLLSGALAALAGIAKAMDDTLLTPTLGYALGLRAFIASVIGGINDLRGAIAGAFLLGLVENLALAALLSCTALASCEAAISKDAIALVLLVGALLVRPRGLFAASMEERP